MSWHFLIEKILCGNKDIEANNTIIMIIVTILPGLLIECSPHIYFPSAGCIKRPNLTVQIAWLWFFVSTPWHCFSTVFVSILAFLSLRRFGYWSVSMLSLTYEKNTSQQTHTKALNFYYFDQKIHNLK